MTRKQSRSLARRAVRTAAVASAAALVLTACGSRVDRASVVSAESGGLAERVAEAQAGAPATGAPIATDTSAVVGAPGQTTGLPATSNEGAAGGSVVATPTPAAGGTKSNSSGGATTPVAAGCPKQGPPVVIGQVGAFSGLIGANTQGAVQTLPVWVRDVNARGGLGCHPVTLFQKDTASDPAKTEAAVQEMVSVRKAVALVASYAPLDVVGLRKGVESAKIVSIGGDQVTPDWHLSPYLYPVGGIEKAQFAGSVKALQPKGVKKIALLYCVESSGCTALKNTLDRDGYAKKFGMDIVYQTQFSLTQADFTSACQAAKNAGAEAIVIAVDAGGLARTARSCATVGLKVPFAIASTAATFDVGDKNLQEASVYIAAPVFPFVSTSDNQAIKDFRAAMARYNPAAEINAAAAMTWSSAKMLERAVELLGPSAQDVPLSREMILKGLGMVKKETLGGLIPATTYTANQPMAAENFCFAPIAFDRRGYYAPTGARFDCI